MAGCFRKLHVALDDHAEHEFLEVALHLVIDLTGEVEAAVIHRQQETFNFKGGVGFPFDNADGVEKFGNAFQCKIFALNRNDDGVRCGERVDRDETQRRGAVDEDEIIFTPQRVKHVLHDAFALFEVEHFDFGSHEVDAGGNDIKFFNVGRVDGFVNVLASNQTFIDGAVHLAQVHAES